MNYPEKRVDLAVFSVFNITLITSLPARECVNPAVPSNGGSMPREHAAAPGDNPAGQTRPAEP